MKILSRSLIVYNLIFLLLLTIVYLIILSWPNLYLMSLDLIVLTVKNKFYPYLSIPYLFLCILFIFKQKKISLYLTSVYFISSIVYMNYILLVQFNKFILISNFLYIFIMYYSLETWNVYLNLAAFNPGIDKHNIVKENSFAIAAELIEDSKGHNLFKQRGLITSCDSLSCFVLFKDMDKLFFEKDIVLELFDAKISQKNKSSKDKKIFQLTPACRNDVGIGFLASRQKEEQITWQQNYRFMKRRGIF